jgi:hypothetical protein
VIARERRGDERAKIIGSFGASSEEFTVGRSAQAARGSVGVEHDSAGERPLLGPVADNEAVPGEEKDGGFEAQLRNALFAGRECAIPWDHDARRIIGAGMMDVDSRAVAQGSRRGTAGVGEACRFFEQDVRDFVGLAKVRQSDRVATLDACV